ncbi:MAG: NAD(P)H-quinone oxidoreductase [Gammaproteobacteria bacterium]|nr:NAD(P)H-quinone oxidoreductase [Gammaproteobacteria bacterium]
MLAVTITQPGGPDVLVASEYSKPVCKKGQVLIEIEAAGLNRPDLMQRKGLYPPPPGASEIPGLEVSGTVIDSHDSVQTPAIGDKVCALVTGGGYAQYCCADAVLCLPVPEGLSMTEAAGLPEVLFTVWSNLVDQGQLVPGDSCLIHGGSGGIGSMAIQLAKNLGATVFTTAGSDEKCQFCLELGADFVINYQTEDFVDVIVQATSDQAQTGVNLILDNVGGDYLQRNLKCLARNGRLLQIAMQNGPKTSINLLPVLLNALTIKGSVLRPKSVDDKYCIAKNLLKHVWPLLEQGKIKVFIDRTFPLADAGKAHRYMEQGRHQGKIILKTDKALNHD